MEDKTDKCADIDLSEIERTVDVSEFMQTYDVLGQETTVSPEQKAKVLAGSVQVGSRNIDLSEIKRPVSVSELMKTYNLT
ncbi:MAG TPA: hypothetical protein DF774_17905 [Rheinheimera sp.]|uniref:hypothetical protein n=1 Tax=Rheinheimera sp. TaxID=1869214 RepID=UPI000ED5605C|nr:hypothetical protein [Rheinheimera sp.]HCU67626.1 hypothetical protein [Rheinheimera sp.]